MWFINEKRQVVELERRAQEKRARQMATRPEPTIYGNCDSWSFIVGKKPATGSPAYRLQGALPRCNRDFIHSLFTNATPTDLNNLWVICGSPVHCRMASRMVDQGRFDIPIDSHECSPFYPIWLLGIFNVSNR
ncbi:MAG: hypothetical protein F9K35_02020 [Burkholderiaceae bacterium]|nr:MAG: hypothetical protein F9K35_02020 [Burkholderiaceae bacterium]